MRKEVKVRRYKKKPIVVESILWDGKQHRPMFEFLGGSPDSYVSTSNDCFYMDNELNLVIRTSEGDMVANIGDYIIKEPFDNDRGYYPCKPSVFKQTYEEVV